MLESVAKKYNSNKLEVFFSFTTSFSLSLFKRDFFVKFFYHNHVNPVSNRALALALANNKEPPASQQAAVKKKQQGKPAF